MGVVDAEHPPVRTRTSDGGEELCQLKTGLAPDGSKLQAKIVSQFLGE